MSIEIREGIPVITPDTTKNDFPRGGAIVRIGDGVLVTRGLDHGPIAGRGIIVFHNSCSPEPVKNPTPRYQPSDIDNMNA